MGVSSFGQAFKPYLVEIAKTLLVWLTSWAALVSFLRTSFGDAQPLVAAIDTAIWYQRHPHASCHLFHDRGGIVLVGCMKLFGTK
jgi:hypothetical protein